MEKITVTSTGHKQVIDITDKINKWLKKYDQSQGLCNLFVTHTTASLTIADLDPGTDLDLLEAIDKMVPKLTYRHPHDPNHVGDHIFSSIIGCCVTIPFDNKQLVLGAWQRVVLIELNGPKDRTVIINIV